MGRENRRAVVHNRRARRRAFVDAQPDNGPRSVEVQMIDRRTRDVPGLYLARQSDRTWFKVFLLVGAVLMVVVFA